MDWSRLRTCNACGAACPAEAEECVRCGSFDLGPEEIPSSPPPPTEQLDLRQDELPPASCPSCHTEADQPGLLLPSTLPPQYTRFIIPGAKCTKCGAVFPHCAVAAELTAELADAVPAVKPEMTDWIFVPASPVICCEPQEDDEQQAEIRFAFITLPLRPLRDLAADVPDSCCYRLYVIPALDVKGLVVTVLTSPTRNWVEVTPLIGTKPLPDEWRTCIGHSEATNLEALKTELESLPIWELPDCVPNIRDGIGFYHVAAKSGQEHAILISNPEYGSDLRYVDVVNAYAKRVLNGLFAQQFGKGDEFRKKNGNASPETGIARILNFAMQISWALFGFGFLLLLFTFVSTGGGVSIGARITPHGFFLGTKEGVVSVSRAAFLTSAVATFMAGLFGPLAAFLDDRLHPESFHDRNAFRVVLFHMMLILWSLFLVGHSTRLIIRAIAGS